MIRGGPFLWFHTLITWGLLIGSVPFAVALLVGSAVSRDRLSWFLLLPGSWLALVAVATARVRLVVEADRVVIRNGWYGTSVALADIAQVTRQRLPSGGGGRGWVHCLAIWLDGAQEGVPCLATVRYSDARVDELASKLRESVGVVPGVGMVPLYLGRVNAGWSPGAWARRRGRADG